MASLVDTASPAVAYLHRQPGCSISSPAIGKLPPEAPLTGQNPRTVRIGLWHALWGVTSALFIFDCLFACLASLSAGTHYDRL